MQSLTEKTARMNTIHPDFSRQGTDLKSLLAEILALSGILPPLGQRSAQEREEIRLAREAEIEAGFDNMPV